jgi:CDP-2,3-bis-(O-geranylgeranyl)-sn-glycerol synthase
MRRALSVVVRALWVMLPAYVPNNVAVLTGGGDPIDGERIWRGKRLLGDGKTWRGTVWGAISGVAVALSLDALAGRLAARGLSVPLPRFGCAAITLPVGALGGDMLASFYKRQRGHNRGAPVIGLDQLDFVVGALLLTALSVPRWFRRNFRLPVLFAVFVLTPLLHFGANLLAYLLGFKAEPY